jgi:uncharacterized protein YxjI
LPRGIGPKSSATYLAFCTSCGKEIDFNSAFCPYCGHQAGFNQSSLAQGSSVQAMPSSAMPFGGGSGPLEVNDIVMKKKILSLREHYDLEDRQGNKLGEGDGNFFQFPAKFQVLDNSRAEIMHVDGKLISLRRQFTFHDDTGNQLGEIKKKLLKLFGSEYWVEQNGIQLLRIYGNFVEHDYKFEMNKQLVAQVHKKWAAVRDTFGISISGKVDHRIVIGSAIAIEHEEVTERHH